MDFEELYKTSLKMIKDKFGINQYVKEDFLIIYKTFYQENQTATNELNKEVLKKINQILIETFQLKLNYLQFYASKKLLYFLLCFRFDTRLRIGYGLQESGTLIPR